MKTLFFSALAVCLVFAGCSGATSNDPATTSAAGNITITFDYSAAELMLQTLQRGTLSEADANALLANRGVAAIVDKTRVWVPELRREDFIPYVRGVMAGTAPFSAFNLADIIEQRAEIETLISTLKRNEAAITKRMTSRLARYAPVTGPLNIEVFFVAGGSSDGFVLDDDPRRAFFVAIDKASGDADGVEQNMTHELYHVMQKASIQRSPEAARVASAIDNQPLLRQLFVTTLLEGTANFVADARETAGTGPYVSMWRGRYERNQTPERMRENFALFDSILADLSAGKINWQEAYDRGFSGSDDSRLYFVGMEMARALVAAHGPRYFDSLFTDPPEKFFRDYAVLAARDQALPQFSAASRAIIDQQPRSW